jgi:hypothetical protein
MVENKNVSGFWWEKRERDNFEEKGVDGTQNPSRSSGNGMESSVYGGE